jgi:hypothetical protein
MGLFMIRRNLDCFNRNLHIKRKQNDRRFKTGKLWIAIGASFYMCFNKIDKKHSILLTFLLKHI